jgi:hypothetical protein
MFQEDVKRDEKTVLQALATVQEQFGPSEVTMLLFLL